VAELNRRRHRGKDQADAEGGRRPAAGRAHHAAAAGDERPVEEGGPGHANAAVGLHQYYERGLLQIVNNATTLGACHALCCHASHVCYVFLIAFRLIEVCRCASIYEAQIMYRAKYSCVCMLYRTSWPSARHPQAERRRDGHERLHGAERLDHRAGEDRRAEPRAADRGARCVCVSAMSPCISA
jgi:hypothetical protein